MVFNIVASLVFDVRIYQFPNSGRLYDLGYVIGAAAFFGGSHGVLRGEDDVRHRERQQEDDAQHRERQQRDIRIRNRLFSLAPTELETMIASMQDDERDALRRFAEGALKCLPRYRRIWL